MNKLLITGWVPENIIAPFRKDFDITVPDEKKEFFSFDEVKAMIGDYDALFTVAGFKFQPELIDLATKMKAVGTLGVGYDHIDVAYCTQKNIFVVNTPQAVCEPTAEFCFAIMMAIAKGVVMYDKELRVTKMASPPIFFDRDILLYGKTIGILGYGRIGQAVGRKAQGIGMNVMYYDPFRQTPEREKELGATYGSFDEVISKADVISCHMPFTKENYHIINADVFKKMKKTAYFVNGARGPIMDERALAAAVKAGEIRGAATDVYEFEPVVTEELAALDNVVITPHVASNVLEARSNMVNEALSGVRSVLGGEYPHNIVNRELMK